MHKWPFEANALEYYGRAGSGQSRAHIAYPLRLSWNLNSTITSFRCHGKIKDAVEGIFKDTLDHYGIAEIKWLELDIFGGCLSIRNKRNGHTPSMHSYGIAIDMNPVQNRLGWSSKRAMYAQPSYDSFWQIVESFGGVSLGREKDFDWMHFQFARLDE